MQHKSSAVVALLAALLISGCKPAVAPPTAPVQLYSGVVLDIACPDPLTKRIVEEQGKPWAKSHGAQLHVLSYQRGKDDPPAADIWVVAPAEMPRWAAAGKLLSVPDSCRKDAGYAWDDLIPLYRERLLQWHERDKLGEWHEKTYALPLVGESPLCFYRADLFQSPEHRAAFRKEKGRELAAPTTWEEFADLAEFFARQLDRPSLPPLPRDDEDMDREFHSVAAPYVRRAVSSEDKTSRAETFSFHCDLDTGQLRLETPGFVHALKLLQRLQACRPTGTHPNPPEAFRDGEAVLCLADASWIDRFHKGAVKAHFGVCRVPGSSCWFSYDKGEWREARDGNRIPYLGSAGWLAVVPAQAKNPAAAFALLAHLSGREVSRQIVLAPTLGGGGVYREDHFGPNAFDSFDLNRAQTHDLLTALHATLKYPGIKNPLLRLRTPDQQEHLEALASEVRSALQKQIPAKEALAAAARRWEKLDSAKPEQERKTEYLQSLSLTGKP